MRPGRVGESAGEGRTADRKFSVTWALETRAQGQRGAWGSPSLARPIEAGAPFRKRELGV